MAREKKPEEPKDDIPAWFMTYSDVITLLMTFFILLLTFATTEPERFEKSISSSFARGSATGRVGKKMKGIDKDSWVQRVRAPAARIAMRGAEMPPIEKAPVKETWGDGLRSLNQDEAKQNEMTSHSFDVDIALLFDSEDKLTPEGKQLCQVLSGQLKELPFHAAIQFSDERHTERLGEMMEYLFHTEMTRPGQVSMSYVRPHKVPGNKARVTIKRFNLAKNGSN